MTRIQLTDILKLIKICILSEAKQCRARLTISFMQSSIFIEGTTRFQLQIPVQKISKLLPAFNDTFVLLVITRAGYQESILHLDNSGREIYRCSAKDTINHMTMLNAHTVAYCTILDSKVLLIDLKTRTITGLNHEFISDCTAAVDIDFFAETRLIVLIERGTYEEHRLRLVYLTEKEQGEPVAEYMTKEGEFQHPYLVTKGNTHSMIIWTKNNFQESLVLWILDLREPVATGVQREPRRININNMAPYATSNSISCLTCVWECRPDCFLLACNSQREKANPHQANNSNYIYDTKTGIFRESKFIFEGLDNEKLIDQYNFGDYSIFPTFNYKNGVAINSTVYLVHNQSEQIVGRAVWRSESTYQIQTVAYDPNSVLLTEYAPGDPKEVAVTYMKFVSPRDVYLRFMLHLNKDFDDDILQEAIELLDQ